MASYVPSYDKKYFRRILLEDKLLSSISRGESRARQLALAEEVRFAKIREVKAEQSRRVPPDSRQRMRPYNERIAALEQITAEQILHEFTVKAARIARNA